MLSDQIKKYMKLRKMRNKDLIEVTGIPAGTLNKIICGLTPNPRIYHIQAIADALGCTLDDLRDDSERAIPVLEKRTIPEPERTIPEPERTIPEPEKTTPEEEEMRKYLEELRTRPEMKTLFSLAKNASTEEVKQAVKVLEALNMVKNMGMLKEDGGKEG